MAEQVKLPIPALPVPSRYAKRMKMVQEKKAASQQRKRETCKTRIYIGVAFDRWQTLKVSKRLKSDAELAVLLLDCYERNDLQSTPLTASASATTSIMQEVVPSSATRSCTSDPDTSAPILTEVIGYTDESDSSDEEENTMVSDHSSDSDGLKQAGLKLRQLCPECGKRFNIQKTHTCESKLKPFSCTVCGKRFVTEHYLKIHSKIHNEGCEHVCKFCFSTFKTKLDKIVHEQSHPRVKKPFQCPDCPEVFAKRKERNNHMMGHRGPKKYICHICNMEFPHTSALERHVVVHTGEKQFVCEVCQRSFSQTGHLKSHMRVHTGEKPFQCQHCDKSFNHNVSLKSHMQRYHGQVPEPGMEVQMEKPRRNESAAELDETNEMENNAALFICHICNMEFPYSGVLEKHVVVQTGEKQFVCEACQRSFSQSGHLKSHMQVPDPGINVQMKKTNRKEAEAELDERGERTAVKNNAADTEQAESSKKDTRCIPEEEEEEDVDDEGEKEEDEKKGNKRHTGRPKGRPKRNAGITSDITDKLKRKSCSGDENDEGQSNSELASTVVEEEEEEKQG